MRYALLFLALFGVALALILSFAPRSQAYVLEEGFVQYPMPMIVGVDEVTGFGVANVTVAQFRAAADIALKSWADLPDSSITYRWAEPGEAPNITFRFYVYAGPFPVAQISGSLGGPPDAPLTKGVIINATRAFDWN